MNMILGEKMIKTQSELAVSIFDERYLVASSTVTLFINVTKTKLHWSDTFTNLFFQYISQRKGFSDKISELRCTKLIEDDGLQLKNVFSLKKIDLHFIQKNTITSADNHNFIQSQFFLATAKLFIESGNVYIETKSTTLQNLNFLNDFLFLCCKSCVFGVFRPFSVVFLF